MINHAISSSPMYPPSRSVVRRFRQYFAGCLVLSLLWAGSAMGAESLEDQFLRVYGLIDRGDTLVEKGQKPEARAVYENAWRVLKDIQKENKNWNAQAVNYRLSYVTERLTTLAKADAPVIIETNTPTASASKDLPANTRYKLLEAGGEPRKVLRLQIKEGDRQEFTLRVKVDMDMGAMAMKMPVMKYAMSTEIKELAANGNISYELTIDDAVVEETPDAMAAMVDVMKATAAGAKGLKSHVTVSGRGFTRKVDLTLPADISPVVSQGLSQMKDMLAQFGMQLPDEPVGLGAKWEVHQKLKAQGINLEMTKTHTLAAAEGDNVTIETAVTQTAANQKVSNPAMPQVQVDLTKLTGTGNAKMVADLTKVVPLDVTYHDKAEVAMNLGAASQNQAMVIKTDTSVTIQPK